MASGSPSIQGLFQLIKPKALSAVSTLRSPTPTHGVGGTHLFCVSSDPWQTLPQSGDTVTPVLQRLVHSRGDRERPVLSNDNELDDLLQLICKAPGVRAGTSEALQ